MVLLFLFTCLCPYIQFHSNNNSNCWWFLLLFYYIQVSKLLFPNYCWFKYTSINSIVLVTRLSSALDHYFFSISSLSLPRPFLLIFFLIPQTVTWPILSKSVTKFGRPKAMMPVPIFFLLIRSYLVNWPFYLSVFCVNVWYGPAPVLFILTSIVCLPCYILWPYS